MKKENMQVTHSTIKYSVLTNAGKLDGSLLGYKGKPNTRVNNLIAQTIIQV